MNLNKLTNKHWNVLGIILLTLGITAIFLIPFIILDDGYFLRIFEQPNIEQTPIVAEEIYSLTVKINYREQTVCHIIHGKYDLSIQPGISCVAMCSQEGYKFSENFRDLQVSPLDSDSKNLMEIIDLLDLEKPVISEVEYFEMELSEQ